MGSVARALRENDRDRGDRHFKRRAPDRYFHHIARVRKTGVKPCRTRIPDVSVSLRVKGHGNRVLQETAGVHH